MTNSKICLENFTKLNKYSYRKMLEKIEPISKKLFKK